MIPCLQEKKRSLKFKKFEKILYQEVLMYVDFEEQTRHYLIPYYFYRTSIEQAGNGQSRGYIQGSKSAKYLQL